MSSDLTPMMRQYLDIKQEHEDAILFFRLGDFYEMFFDDAIEATRILHITLTSRGKSGDKKIPMCGVPHHAAKNYIARLIRSGKKVAICEQVEEPSDEKKIVKREVTKIITPGTFLSDELLGEAVNNYILSISGKEGLFGLAYADLSTGEFRVTELDDDGDLFSELYKISPSECLVSESLSSDSHFQKLKEVDLGAITVSDDWMFDSELSRKEIKDHFMVDTLEGFGCEGLDLAVGAAGALLKYLKNTQKTKLNNIDSMSTYRATQYMALDRTSHRHLELIQNQEDLSSANTLFDVLDNTRTPMGKRRLKRCILNPLLDIKKIDERLDAVEYFHDNTSCREGVRLLLGDIYDIERLSNKISLGSANGRDMRALASSLGNVAGLKKKIAGKPPEYLKAIVEDLDDLDDIREWIDKAIVEEPPLTITGGGIIKDGYNSEIDELKYLVTHGKDWVAGLQKREIEKTGINSLKVGYNKVFGYYIEVTKSNLDAVPEHYVRKQTLVNAERFITDELKKEEVKIIGAEERLKALEYDAFCSIRDKVAEEIERLKRTADKISKIDVFAALAEAAAKGNYSRPKLNNTGSIEISEGRHPVLEKILKSKEFVPNDLMMDNNNRIFIITGSNMAGKSTYIRQIALITIMAQIGSFIPAKKADIGIVDRVFTRVGASDRLYKGMSTFMVEMLETANILNNSTEKSLIILDEIGRGTSTFDGVSIAWAVVEYIHHKRQGAKTMFATHYHELTELTDLMEGVKNYHLAVEEWKDEIVFLYKVKEGSCDESFGIHVAKLAGMPGEVVKRSKEILNNLQKDSLLGNMRSRFSEKKGQTKKQFDFFENAVIDNPAIDKIKKLDVNKLTPLEALEKLAELQKEAEK